MAKPVWTDAQIIAQMDSGAHWSGNSITYGFPTIASWFPYGEKAGFSPLSSVQQVTATLAIKLWDDLISPTVTRASNSLAADIKYSNTTTNIGYAQAYFPDSDAAGGSVWFNPNYGLTSGTNNLVTPVAGQWGFQAYIHEPGTPSGSIIRAPIMAARRPMRTMRCSCRICSNTRSCPISRLPIPARTGSRATAGDISQRPP